MSVQAVQPLADLDESLQLNPAELRRRLQETEETLRAERDRSERAHAESLREQQEFLSIVAHEVRNPLASIQHAVELLRLPTATAAQKQRAIDIIESQVRDQHRMLNDLLDASRIVRGKIELLNQPIG